MASHQPLLSFYPVYRFIYATFIHYGMLTSGK